MRWIVEWSLKFRLLVIVFAAFLIAFGISQLREMPVDVLPEFAPSYIEVQVEAPGLSAAEVEELITFNLEELLAGLPWLESIRSTTMTGLSSVSLTFKPGTDVIRARQLVSERLTTAYTLPNVGQAPIILQPLSAMSRVMMVGLSSKQLSLMDVSLLARWNIRPALLSVPGVANVAIWGMRDKQLQVQVDPKILQANHLKLDQIIATTGNALWVSSLSFLNASTPGSGGWIDTPQQRIEVRHVLPISSPKELAQVNIDNSKLNLGAATNVVENHQPLIGDVILKNGPGLMIFIEKFPGANPLKVTQDVKAKLDELKAGLSGIQIDTNIFQPDNFIEKSIYNTFIAIIASLIFLTLILFLCLYSWRAVLVSLTSIVLSLLAAAIVLSLRGFSMNIMIFAGLVMVFVIIVDDAIIDVENIQRRLNEDKRTDPSQLITDVFLATRGSMIYGTVILILTLLPFFFWYGSAAVFYQSIAISFVLALLASMVLTLIITPALSLLLLPGQQSFRVSPILSWCHDRYDTYLTKFIEKISAFFLIILTAVLAIITVLGLVWLFWSGSPLLPQFKERDIMIQWQSPPGTSASEMVRITGLAVREIQSIPGVNNVAATIGRAILGDRIVDVNSAEIMVNMSPTARFDTTLATIQKTVDSYPGIINTTQTYFNSKVKLALTGTSADILIRIFGPDFQTLHQQAEVLKKELQGVEGVVDLRIEQAILQPQITVEASLPLAERYGLTPGDVRRTSATYVAGIEAGSLFQHQKVFPVVVWGTPETRHSLNSLNDLLINASNDQWVRLADVATVKIVPAPTFIKHNTISRSIDVSLNVRGENPYGVMDEIKEIVSELKLPLEYRAVILGAYKQSFIQSHPLMLALLTSIAIFLIFQAVFASFRLALAVFLTLPAALFGGVLVALLLGDSISIFALFGLLAIYGIATRNTILMITYLQQLALSKRDEPQLIIDAARARFASIFITILAAGFALIPLAFLGNISGQEITNPMVLIILGSLVTTIFFNLFIVPALYLLWGEERSKQDAL